MRTSLTLSLLAAGALAASPCGATIILNETYDVGAAPSSADDGDDPNDTAWTTFGTGNGTLTVLTRGGFTGNAMRNQGGGTFRGQQGNFLSAASLTSPGDTLSLTMDFQTNNAPGLGNRNDAYSIGMFDEFGAGYFLRMGSGTTNSLTLHRDDGTGDPADNNGMTVLATDTSAEAPAIAGGVFSVSILLTRTASGVQLDADVAGSTLSFEDTTGALSGFTNVTTAAGNHSIDWWQDDIVVDFTPVPEPSALALLGAVIVAPALRRRRIRN